MLNRLPILYSVIALISAGIISGGIYLGMTVKIQSGLDVKQESADSSTVVVEEEVSSSAEGVSIASETLVVEQEQADAAAKPTNSTTRTPSVATVPSASETVEETESDIVAESEDSDEEEPETAEDVVNDVDQEAAAPAQEAPAPPLVCTDVTAMNSFLGNKTSGDYQALYSVCVSYWSASTRNAVTSIISQTQAAERQAAQADEYAAYRNCNDVEWPAYLNGAALSPSQISSLWDGFMDNCMASAGY